MDYAAELIVENAAFAELLRDADLSILVPTCPDWSLDQLMRHVGRGDRWCAQIVAEQAADFIDPRTVAGGKPPPGREDTIDWVYEGPRKLLAAVEATGPETTVWTFLGPRPAKWWIRRRADEIAVHRADAAIALGADFEIDPALAAEVITEWLERLVIQAGAEGPAGGDRPLGDGQSLHLHATDSGLDVGEWTILGRPDGIAVDHEHGKATTALRGPARDLMLALTGRRPTADSGLEMFGDPAVWDTWLARTPF